MAGHFVAKGPLRGQLTREIRGHFVAEFQYLLMRSYLHPGSACIIVILFYVFYSSFWSGSKVVGFNGRLPCTTEKLPTSSLDREHFALEHSSARNAKLAVVIFNTQETSYAVLSLKNMQRKVAHPTTEQPPDIQYVTRIHAPSRIRFDCVL